MSRRKNIKPSRFPKPPSATTGYSSSPRGSIPVQSDGAIEMSESKPPTQPNFLSGIRNHPIYALLSMGGSCLLGGLAVLTWLYGPGVLRHEGPIEVQLETATTTAADPIYSSLRAFMDKTQSLQNDPAGLADFKKAIDGQQVSWVVYITNIALNETNDVIVFDTDKNDEMGRLEYSAVSSEGSLDGKLRMLKAGDRVLVQGTFVRDGYIKLTEVQRK